MMTFFRFTGWKRANNLIAEVEVNEMDSNPKMKIFSLIFKILCFVACMYQVTIVLFGSSSNKDSIRISPVET